MAMTIDNAHIARVFEEIADSLDIQQANPYRIRAYRDAARTIENMVFDLASAVVAGTAPRLPGIGNDLIKKIREIAKRGTCATLIQLHKELPASVTTLLGVPGLGAKRVRTIYHH